MRVELFNGSKTYAGGPYSSLQVNGSLRNYQYTQSLLRNSLSYQKTFNKVHRFSLFGAFEVQQSKIKDGRIAGYDLPNEELGLSGIDAGTINPFPNTYSSSSSSAIVSGLMQATYNYKSRYYLTGSIRTDGSSRFRAENRWGYFPSGSVKWKFSEEEFMKGLTFISDANIRTSYGSTGNNNIGDYASYSEISYQNPLTINNTLQPNSAVVTRLDNPDLTWEKATQFDVGLDIGFMKNKITLTAEYYKKNVFDLLFAASMPGSSGYNSTTKNIGEISNEGMEFTVVTDIIKTTDFGWNSNFNISFVRNRLEALSSRDEEGLTRGLSWEQNFNGVDAYIAKLGGPLGQIFGLISDGIYQVDDFDRTATGGWVLKPHISGIAGQQPGDPKYKDLDKNGVVNDLDRAVIGRGYPIHQGGFSNNFRYKAFDLNVFLRWSYGTEVINANRIWFESGFGVAFRPGYNQFSDGMDRWSIDNQDAKYPRINANYVKGYSTDYVEDGSFLRLSAINLGYNVPKELLNRLNISRLRVFLSGTNLLTLSKYKGYDPEVSSYSNLLTPGMDWSSYPRPLTVTAGINLQF
jgi:TonB-linked SusC/RagA family outer membrane protein